MGQLGSAIDSALTRRGTNAREGQENTQSGIANSAAGLYNSYAPTAQSQFNFAGLSEPQRQQLIGHIVNLSNPNNFWGMAQGVGNQARQNGLQNANYAAGMWGQNSGAAMGARAAGINVGTGAQNSFLSQLHSPQNQQQLYQTGLTALNGAANPSTNILAQLASLVYGQPQIQTGPGLGDLLGQVAGQVVAKKA